MKPKVINLFEKNKEAQKQEYDYAKLLEQFMAPFKNDFEALEDFEYYEDLVEFAIGAWNIGNMKRIMLRNGFDDMPEPLDPNRPYADVQDRMIAYKLSNFSDFTQFFVHFEITETDGHPILNVITQEEDVFLSAMEQEVMGFEDFGEARTRGDYEENFINRNAIIIRPRQPFIDWLNTIFPEEENLVLDDVDDPSIYLVDEEIDDLDQWLKKKFNKIFTEELENWADKKKWPKRRTHNMFLQWFKVSISMSVYDLEKQPVSKWE